MPSPGDIAAPHTQTQRRGTHDFLAILAAPTVCLPWPETGSQCTVTCYPVATPPAPGVGVHVLSLLDRACDLSPDSEL